MVLCIHCLLWRAPALRRPCAASVTARRMYQRGGHDGRSLPPAKLVEFLTNNPWLPKKPPLIRNSLPSSSAEAASSTQSQQLQSDLSRAPIEPVSFACCARRRVPTTRTPASQRGP
eukprot:6214393-Pleurochrysis_carterae.AAC.1